MRTRDELFDRMDRLPRPILLQDYPTTFGILSYAGDDYVRAESIPERLIMRECFAALPAEERYP